MKREVAMFSYWYLYRCTVPKEPCTGDLCKNGGTCVAGGVIRHKCVCLPGYTGEDCSIDTGKYY